MCFVLRVILMKSMITNIVDFIYFPRKIIWTKNSKKKGIGW
jgi:hypothetical protein